jgi:hypothetical protein
MSFTSAKSYEISYLVRPVSRINIVNDETYVISALIHFCCSGSLLLVARELSQEFVTSHATVFSCHGSHNRLQYSIRRATNNLFIYREYVIVFPSASVSVLHPPPSELKSRKLRGGTGGQKEKNIASMCLETSWWEYWAGEAKVKLKREKIARWS